MTIGNIGMGLATILGIVIVFWLFSVFLQCSYGIGIRERPERKK